MSADGGEGEFAPDAGKDSGSLHELFHSLRLADSLFPSGGFGFSWGLEGLFADGELRRGDLPAFLAASFEQKWLSFDAPFLQAAFALAREPARLAELDAELDLRVAGTAQREGSLRAGRALMGVHVRLGTPGAGELRDLMLAGEGGHQPVVLGAMLALCGLGRERAMLVAAYGYLTGLCSAALRLGHASHLDVQSALNAMGVRVAEGLSGPIRSPLEACAFAPLAEIAMLRHPDRTTRLFSN
ncbi:urease accessory protein UreF [Propylenella binzhouense]|nr:urease accessory UreF family protein [Propylenella binzhouense]